MAQKRDRRGEHAAAEARRIAALNPEERTPLQRQFLEKAYQLGVVKRG